jgi:hypothetical protein
MKMGKTKKGQEQEEPAFADHRRCRGERTVPALRLAAKPRHGHPADERQRRRGDSDPDIIIEDLGAANAARDRHRQGHRESRRANRARQDHFTRELHLARFPGRTDDRVKPAWLIVS